MGHVPVIEKPALIIAVNMVSHPVEAVFVSPSLSSLSLCLYLRTSELAGNPENKKSPEPDTGKNQYPAPGSVHFTL